MPKQLKVNDRIPQIAKNKMNEKINIRLMQHSDLDEVLNMEKLCFSDPWSLQAFESELSGLNPCVYFVAEVNGLVCGYMGIWHIIDEGHVTNVAIHPNYRRMGIGEKLVRHTIEHGRKNGLIAFTLEVRKSNDAAKHLYAKCGFETVGVRENYYDNSEDAEIMWLRD